MKHSCGEKSHKCNQCKYATYTADDLTRHIKKTAEKNQTYATNVNIHLPMQVL